MNRDNPVDPVLEKGYNVRLLRDDFPQIAEGWAARSAALRAHVDAQLDCVYGAGPCDKLDVFRCGEVDAPLFVFIHGGYWQRGDKSMYSFIAEAFIDSGVDVALIGYPLCPDISMSSLVERIRTAISWLYRNAVRLGVSAQRINVSGHSAGGHLTAMMLVTQWRGIAQDLPGDLVKSGIPISGLYRLAPLCQTTINDALGMDTSEAQAISPQFLLPGGNAPVLAVLGGAETLQFHQQTDQFVDQWRDYIMPLEKYIEPGVDHFDVINRLSCVDSDVFTKVREWLC